MSSQSSSPSSNTSRLAGLLAKYREQKSLESPSAPVESTIQTLTSQPKESQPVEDSSHIYDKYGNLITLNSSQTSFVSLASTGASCILIGAAGTGKTTTQKAVTQALIQSGKVGLLDPMGHKHLPTGTPGIVICAYTRRAVANIRKNLPTDLQNNAITIHKLLEYQPEYEEIIDPMTGDTKTKMSFSPFRTALNPIPPSVKTLIFEESSMIGTDLYKEVIDACPHNPQLIFLGDIQQLPPVFGPAILGFKLLELPVIELTEVYRQALESPIISLAHRILSGKTISSEEFPSWKKPGQLTIHPWKKKISPQDALNTAGQFFIAAETNKFYDPEEDIILIPFNKSFGTDELNKIIANHLAKKRNAEVYEIIAGFNKHYLSVGDKILYDKEDATILEINPNPAYTGAPTQPHSISMDYWGYDPTPPMKDLNSSDDMDFLLSQVSSASEDRVRQASHILTISMNDSGSVIKVDKAADVNSLLLGYALTVHKSQGSEWRKVFFVSHQSHNTMMQRELLYTAVTRAREELYIICEPDAFIGGITGQRVKGNTLAEKALHFRGKLEEGKDYSSLTPLLKK